MLFLPLPTIEVLFRLILSAKAKASPTKEGERGRKEGKATYTYIQVLVR